MPRYHFDVGNSSEGPIGYSAMIVAPTKEAAVARLKELLPEVLEVSETVGPDPLGPDEYLNVYFNYDNYLTDADIDWIGDDPAADGEAAALDAECDHLAALTDVLRGKEGP